MAKAVAALLGAAVLVALAGCGEAEGVRKGATVTAYVTAPLCAEASRELDRAQGRAGDLRVKAVCLPAGEGHGPLELAAIGDNARRAAEDSTAIAFLEAPSPSNRFSEPVLEAAEIASIHASSGKAAMARLLKAIERADTSGSLRASLSDELR